MSNKIKAVSGNV